MYKKKYKKNKANKAPEQTEVLRVPLPKGNQVIGILEQRLGGSRCKVRCLDGNTRVCRIPGRLKRRLWVRENDIVLIEPWEFGGENRGDIIFKYRPTQVHWLKKKGYLDKLEEVEEF